MQSLILRSHPLLCSFIVMNVVQFIVINVLCETGNSYQKHLDPKSGLFNTLVVAAMGDPEQQRHHHSSHQHHHDDEDNEDNEHTLTKAGPYFDATMAKNVTGMLGKTTYLNCHVHNLANKTVSWVRHRDVHLLTVGMYTYTSDQRFRAVHQPHTPEWTLQIKYLQHRDAGIYECQISTTPHMSFFVHLTVIEPITEILGGPELYIGQGSQINLTCLVYGGAEAPGFVFWNHNGEIINSGSMRGGIRVITEVGHVTRSYLLMENARSSDSGRYQCNPINAQSKNITVHVLNGEHPEAMHGAAYTQQSINIFFNIMFVFLTLFSIL